MQYEIRYRIERIFIISILMFSMSSAYASKEMITWRVINWPPFYILDGQYKGQGLYDGLIDYIAKKMPEYNHVTRELTTARATIEINNNNNICHPSVIMDDLDAYKFENQGTNQEQKSILLSNINSILLPHGIAFNEKKISRPLHKPLDVKKILSDTSLIGGITPNRYHKWLNNVINQYVPSPHLQIQPDYSNLIEMLFAGHVDYIIEYAPVINYQKSIKKDALNISQVTIENKDAPQEVLVAIGCTNNSWGQAIIKKINKILSEEITSPAFWERRLRWYDGQNRVVLRKLYYKHYPRRLSGN